jgi:hypothetical protein
VLFVGSGSGFIFFASAAAASSEKPLWINFRFMVFCVLVLVYARIVVVEQQLGLLVDDRFAVP